MSELSGLQKPAFKARFLFGLLTTHWRFAAYAGAAAFVTALIAMAAFLLGAGTPQYIEVSEPDMALQDDQWPEMDAPVRAAIFGDDGRRLTLGAQDLRNRLLIIDTNHRRSASGAVESTELEEIGDSRLVDGAPTEIDPNEQAYWDWVDSNACLLASGWSGDASAHVAALVRNGVWDCPNWKRSSAAWPLVIKLGFWLGLLSNLLLIAMAGSVIFLIVRQGWRMEKIYQVHSRRYNSWMS